MKRHVYSSQPPSKKKLKRMMLILLIAVFSSQAGINYDMKKSVIASGGETQSGQYQLKAAIGQPVTTKSVSTTYQMSAGFYQQNRDLIFFNQFDYND